VNFVAPDIIRLAVRLPTPCACGSHTVRRNPLSERTVSFLRELTRHYGAPATPIILRRGEHP
jgi:hypothetical protein